MSPYAWGAEYLQGIRPYVGNICPQIGPSLKRKLSPPEPYCGMIRLLPTAKLCTYILLSLSGIDALFANPPLHDGIESFNRFNRRPEVQHSLSPCTSESEDKQPFIHREHHLQQCAISLCGKPEEQKKFYITDENFDNNISPEVMKKFAKLEPRITSLAKSYKARLRELVSQLKKKVTHKNSNGEIDFSNWGKSTYQYLAEFIYEDFVDIATDSSKHPDKRISINILAEGMDSDFLAGLKLFAQKKRQFISTDLYAGIEEGYLTADEAIQKVGSTVKEFEKEMEKIKKSNYPWKDRFLEEYKSTIDFVTKNANKMGDHIENRDGRETDEIYSDIKNFVFNIAYDIRNIKHRIFRNKDRLSSADNPHDFYSFCNNPICFRGIQSFLNIRLKDLIERLEQKTQGPYMEQLLLSQCKSYVAAHSIRNYSTKRIKKMLPRIKQQFLDKLVKRYSSPTYHSFKNYLNKDVSFITDHPSYSDPDTALTNIKEYELPWDPEYSVLTESGLFASLLRYSDNQSNLIDPLRDLDFCNRTNTRSTTNDFFSPQNSTQFPDSPFGKGIINISEQTCNHAHEQGPWTIAHEMGHALSYAFQQEKLSSSSKNKHLHLRACAAATHKQPRPAIESQKLIFFRGDSSRTEEDTADTIASLVYQDSKKLSGCFLLDVDESFSQYHNLLRDRTDDNHSSALLRLLRESVQKDIPLSPSCQQVLEDNKHKYEVKKCSFK